MTTEIQIRQRGACPDCNGTGQVYNHEWAAMSEALNAHKALYSEKTGTELTNRQKEEWIDQYWIERGYAKLGPPDFYFCDTCNGTGTHTLHEWVSIDELRNLLTPPATIDTNQQP